MPDVHKFATKADAHAFLRRLGQERPCLLVTSLKGGDHPCFIVHKENGWQATTTDVHNAMRRLGYKSHRQFVIHNEGYEFVSVKQANELIMTHIQAGAWHIPRRPA